MTTTNNRPRLLVIRPKRDTCKAFYAKFRDFDVDYLDIGVVSNLAFKFINKLGDRVKSADIVCISDNYYFYNLQAVILAKYYNKPVVTILWCTIPNHISTWLPPYSLITKVVVKLTDLFILRNKSAIPFAKSMGVPNSKIKVIYKGVDLKHFYPKTNKNDKQIQVLYVGKLIKSKGVNDLIMVCDRLKNEGLNVKLVLAGGNKFVEYKDLGNLYRSADIFCAPSKEIRLLGIKIWEEYFSYVLMEAQASGLPIVTTKSNGVVEEVDHNNFVLKIGDTDGLYESLKILILNRSLRNKLSKINRSRAEKYFDANKQAKLTEIEILKVLSMSKNR